MTVLLMTIIASQPRRRRELPRQFEPHHRKKRPFRQQRNIPTFTAFMSLAARRPQAVPWLMIEAAKLSMDAPVGRGNASGRAARFPPVGIPAFWPPHFVLFQLGWRTGHSRHFPALFEPIRQAGSFRELRAACRYGGQAE